MESKSRPISLDRFHKGTKGQSATSILSAPALHRKVALTVLDVAVLDLLQNLRPDIGVALLILLLAPRLQLHNLRKPPALVLQPVGGGSNRGAHDTGRGHRV